MLEVGADDDVAAAVRTRHRRRQPHIHRETRPPRFQRCGPRAASPPRYRGSGLAPDRNGNQGGSMICCHDLQARRVTLRRFAAGESGGAGQPSREWIGGRLSSPMFIHDRDEPYRPQIRGLDGVAGPTHCRPCRRHARGHRGRRRTHAAQSPDAASGRVATPARRHPRRRRHHRRRSARRGGRNHPRQGRSDAGAR